MVAVGCLVTPSQVDIGTMAPTVWLRSFLVLAWAVSSNPPGRSVCPIEAVVKPEWHHSLSFKLLDTRAIVAAPSSARSFVV